MEDKTVVLAAGKRCFHSPRLCVFRFITAVLLCVRRSSLESRCTAVTPPPVDHTVLTATQHVYVTYFLPEEKMLNRVGDE